MNIPKISTATMRNLTLAIGLATTVSCATPCNCKNTESYENFTKEATEIFMHSKSNSLVKIYQNIFKNILK